MDFITRLPPARWQGKIYNAVLVIIDLYTKYAIYLPTTKDLDAPGLAYLLTERFVANFGMLARIISDRGSLFTSDFWLTLCFCLGSRHKLTTAYHP
jgi:hypothetical protein